MKVLVTGANGMLGRWVVAALLQRGHGVRAFVRSQAAADLLGSHIECTIGDLRTSTQLAAALQGIDVVLHLAAALRGTDEAQFASTVTGTERLIHAMQSAGVRRLVLASSFSVYDWAGLGRTLSETSPLEPDLYRRDGYAIAKVWQERIVRRAAERQGWSVAVLRPGFIWGPDGGMVSGVGHSVGRLTLVIGPFSGLPMTHVTNCADAFVTVAERMTDAPGVDTFNVVDGHQVSRWRLARLHCGQGERRQRLIPVPYLFGLFVSTIAQATARALFGPRSRLPSILTPIRYRARFRPVRSSARKLREAIGWVPPHDLEACLAMTFGQHARRREAAARSSERAGPTHV